MFCYPDFLWLITCLPQLFLDNPHFPLSTNRLFLVSLFLFDTYDGVNVKNRVDTFYSVKKKFSYTVKKLLLIYNSKGTIQTSHSLGQLPWSHHHNDRRIHTPISSFWMHTGLHNDKDRRPILYGWIRSCKDGSSTCDGSSLSHLSFPSPSRLSTGFSSVTQITVYDSYTHFDRTSMNPVTPKRDKVNSKSVAKICPEDPNR